MINEQTFNLESINWLSKNQIEQHLKLYKGYVSKINEIWDILDKTPSFSNSNPTYSPIRSLMLGQSYALNGVKLHNLYFENITAEITKASGRILQMITRDFGSFDRWVNIMVNAGLAARGWAILALNSIDNKLHVFGLDAHDVGSIWNASPFLVLDVYEHAYFIDYGADRKKYIDEFMQHINWQIVNQRLNKYLNLKNPPMRNVRDAYPCPLFQMYEGF